MYFNQSLDDVVQLTWEEDVKDELGNLTKKEKKFTYDMLTDLQSRLALVSGNQNKEIESAEMIRKFVEASQLFLKSFLLFKKYSIVARNGVGAQQQHRSTG